MKKTHEAFIWICKTEMFCIILSKWRRFHCKSSQITFLKWIYIICLKLYRLSENIFFKSHTFKEQMFLKNDILKTWIFTDKTFNSLSKCKNFYLKLSIKKLSYKSFLNIHSKIQFNPPLPLPSNNWKTSSKLNATRQIVMQLVYNYFI